MVVRITSPHSVQRALNYNEKKVQKEQAECLYAGNYLLNAKQMNFYEKMERLQNLITRNERSKKSNVLHISLNFDPSEKLKRDQLLSIAKLYMEKIGFATQPYLVYQHHDAGHPHLHILTTNIQEDGKRIDTYNIGRNQSEVARKEIEKVFGLVQAQSKGKVQTANLLPVQVQKVQYGKSETIRSITHVLNEVLRQYKFTSLAELNAVLKQYNVAADRGPETSTMYKAKGLVYRLLDQDGNKIGVPIKASLIYSKPILTNLENKFEENKIKRQPDKQKLKVSIDWVLSNKPRSLEQFIEELKKEKIQTVLRQSKVIYGITFIDYRTKAIFNGSDLGKQYSITNLQKNFKDGLTSVQIKPDQNNMPAQLPQHAETPQQSNHPNESILKDLMDTERSFQRLPYELLKKKKRKRPKNL